MSMPLSDLQRNGPVGAVCGRFLLPPVVFAAILLSGCKKPPAAALPPPVVAVMEISPSSVPLSATLIGQLDSPQNIEIRARVEGFVDNMPFTEGVEVKQGDVLFELDQKPYQEQLAAALGSLGEARAALSKYEADVARLKPLAAQKAIPQQDLDNAEAMVEVGKAGVVTAQAKVDSARLNLGYCVVSAPAAGLIGAKQVSIGELVGKGEPTLLATISTLDPIWFYASVSEVNYIKAEEKSKALGRDISSLPLTLLLAGGMEHPDKGRFVFIDRAVDVKTGTLRVRAEFPNTKKLLRPGMFARIRIDLGTRANCLEVPERAVVELQGKTFVWVVTPENTAKQRPVKTGEQNGSNVLILEGLKAGERVIVEGVQKVREDSPVQAVAAAKNPESPVPSAASPPAPASAPAGADKPAKE